MGLSRCLALENVTEVNSKTVSFGLNLGHERVDAIIIGKRITREAQDMSVVEQASQRVHWRSRGDCGTRHRNSV
jgi:hypothetical protein